MSSFYNWCLEHSKYWLLTEWDYAKNLPLTPSTCSRGSDKKVWWICQNGHEWQTHICYRAKCFRPCPICAKTHTLVKGVNDLATVNPKLASQWDYEKNSPLKPNDVLPRSMKKVWWICEKGHNFEATIDNRTKGSGCPLCSHERKTSFPEKAVCYYLSKFFPDIKYNHKTPWLGKSEIDIFIPSLNLAIEYDGERWHQNIKKDLKKDCLLKNHSIKVIRIREPGCPDMKNDCLCIKTEKPISDGSHVIPAIKKLFLFINKTFSLNFMPSVNFTKDTADILNGYYHQVKLHSLSSENPSLAKEWDYEKNGKLTPSMVFPNSGKKAWWKCEKGHEWAAVIASRNNGVGCPYCSGRKVQKGFNDLKTKRPDIALEWDYLKNDITPEDVTSSSNKKVWWKCSVCGREWESKINNRTSSLHTGCPYCAKELNKQSKSAQRSRLAKRGTLLDKYPELCLEWDKNKNLISPNEVTSGSGYKVWWICPKGHSYLAGINKRTGKKPTGCPYCSGKKILSGFNDLSSKFPEIAKDWDRDLNQISPTEVGVNSETKYWWKCSKCGKSWQCSPYKRSSRNQACPFCRENSKRKIKS